VWRQLYGKLNHEPVSRYVLVLGSMLAPNDLLVGDVDLSFVRNRCGYRLVDRPQYMFALDYVVDQNYGQSAPLFSSSWRSYVHGRLAHD
jgi:hypothetical protein